MILVLLFLVVAILIARIHHRRPLPQRSGIHRHAKRETEPASTNAGGMRHYRAKPVEVREGLFRIALEAPDASCRTIADRFNRDHVDQGWSVGKTYVADLLREFKQWRAAPKRHEHSIDNACAVNRVWAIDMTQHRIEPQTQQPLLGILDHGSRRMLTLHALRDRSSIIILRLLLDAIEHYGKPKAVRTDNEAIFTSCTTSRDCQIKFWLGQSTALSYHLPDRATCRLFKSGMTASGLWLDSTCSDVRPEHTAMQSIPLFLAARMSRK